MSLSRYSDLSWDDQHTECLSKLYSLYCDGIFWSDQLLDIGYRGYPDPNYDLDGTVSPPDFIAYNKDGDVQHVSIIDDLSPTDDMENLIETRLSEIEGYRAITEDMINKFLSLRNKSVSVSHQEIVALVPNQSYEEYEQKFNTLSDKLEVILWVIKEDGNPVIEKTVGEHANIELNRQLESGVDVYPNSDDLLYFSRNTDSSLLEFEFIQRLLTYCARETKRTFEFDEIDDIMVDTRPPMLGHIPSEERIEKWKNFIYRLLNIHELLDQKGSDRYQWKQKRFISEPRDRKRILSNLKEELSPGE